MAYNEKLAERIREKLVGLKKLEERRMMGGLCFMFKGKMCCGIVKDDLMVRVISSRYEEALSHPYGRQMDFTGKPLKGFAFVAPDGFKKEKELSYWLDMGIEFVNSLPPAKIKKRAKGKALPSSRKLVKKNTSRNKK